MAVVPRTPPQRLLALVAICAEAHRAPDDPPWPRVPKWNATWSMGASTVFMPCNVSGMFDPAIAGRYGIADFDWSNAKVAWSDAKPMDCEERLVTQAAMVKAVNPDAHVFVCE